MELRIFLEPVLSGISLTFPLSFSRGDEEFQARNVRDHRRGASKSGQPNRGEHLAQMVCPEYQAPFARFSSLLVSGTSVGKGGSQAMWVFHCSAHWCLA